MEEKQFTYARLNNEALSIMVRNLDKETKWEKEQEECFRQLQTKEVLAEMDVPGLTRMAAKYHEANSTHSRKACGEHQKIKKSDVPAEG